jgi:DsbC/DsbD-like thiol-disulfide interchange protein
LQKRSAWIASGSLAFLGLLGAILFFALQKPDGPLPHLASPWQEGISVETRLESAQSALGDGRVNMALHMVLEPGWKTYWRVPGDSGLAPKFDWSGSTNVQSIELLWPTPRAFDELGERFYGYQGKVVWPLRVTANDPERPVQVSLKLDLGVCADVCVPTSIQSNLSVPEGEAKRTIHAELIDAHLAQVPKRAQNENIMAAVRLTDVKGHRAALEISLTGSDPMPQMVIASGLAGVYLGASQPRGDEGFYLQLEGEAPETLKGKPIDLLFLYDRGEPGVEGTFFIE